MRGVTQSIDRAELFALVQATRWTTKNDLYIWSDSFSNVHIAEHIQQHGWVPSNVENYDPWLRFQDALEQRHGRTTTFRWVPSHIHPSQAEDPLGRVALQMEQ